MNIRPLKRSHTSLSNSIGQWFLLGGKGWGRWFFHFIRHQKTWLSRGIYGKLYYPVLWSLYPLQKPHINSLVLPLLNMWSSALGVFRVALPLGKHPLRVRYKTPPDSMSELAKNKSGWNEMSVLKPKKKSNLEEFCNLFAPIICTWRKCSGCNSMFFATYGFADVVVSWLIWYRYLSMRFFRPSIYHAHIQPL